MNVTSRRAKRRMAASALALMVGAGMILAGPAVAAPGDITLASTSDTGAKGNDSSTIPSISGDASRVAFESLANNLDPGDTDSAFDVYVKDLTTGDITLASTSDTGVKGNGDGLNPSISSDGTKVAFYSVATNLDPGDIDFLNDIYVKDLTTGDITLASTSDTGEKGSSDSFNPSISSDGTKVAFYSHASNLDPGDTDSSPDIYVKDLTTGDIKLASTADFEGVKGNSDSFNPSISSDETKVAFYSLATNLDPGDTDSFLDIYVMDLLTGNITLASTSDAGVKGNSDSIDAAISANGTRVVFWSFATNLDPGDTDSSSDVYVKDLTTGGITLASTSDAGVKGNSESRNGGISSDGTKVAFHSFATNLDPGDTDSRLDIYVKDLATGDITLASTSDTGVNGDLDSFRPSISSDGTKVAFESNATNLDPADPDFIFDVYVKELGGAPAPSADLSLTKSDSPDPVTVGDTLTYTLTVANAGPDGAADATVTDQLPGSVTFSSAAATQGSCSEAAGTVTCTLGAIASGAGATVTIEVTPNSAGTITDTASVSSTTADPQGANNSDSEDTTVQPPAGVQADLSVTKSDTRDPVPAGKRLGYRLAVRNLGPDAATGVTLTDQLPAGVTFESAQSTQGTCAQAGGVVTCNLGPMASGGQARVTIRVRTTAAGVITNNADVTATEADPNSANNHDSETTTVQ